MTFAEPDQPDLPRAHLDALLERGTLLEDASRKIGLYAQSVNVATSVDPNTGEPGQPVLLATFLIGDVAFSPRVQDPEQAAVNEEFSKMESDVASDPSATIEGLTALRDRLQKKGDDDEVTPEAE